jgi:hypothetical protein
MERAARDNAVAAALSSDSSPRANAGVEGHRQIAWRVPVRRPGVYPAPSGGVIEARDDRTNVKETGIG